MGVGGIKSLVEDSDASGDVGEDGAAGARRVQGISTLRSRSRSHRNNDERHFQLV